MKKKKNLIIIAAVVVVGLLALIIAKRGSRSATFEQDFHVEDIASVSKVFIADKQNNQVLLERVIDSTGDTTWLVDGLHPASQPMIDLLLETLHDMRIRQQVNKNAIPQAVKQLSARAVKVEVYQHRWFINWFGGKLRLFPHERLAVTYFVGHETQDMMACYMFRKGDKAPYIIHIPGFRGYLTPRFVSDPMSWRSHEIVHWDIRHLQSVELDIPASPQESFVVRREGDDFVMELTQGHRMVDGFDTARVAQMLSSFANLNFDEFASRVPNSYIDTSFNSAPRTILRITNTDGETREVKTYLKYVNPEDSLAMPDTSMYEMFDVNRLYAIIDNKDSVLIQYFVFDNILQPASFFINKDMRKSEIGAVAARP
ncbi:MAG: DUF4340 domain-containing protein [Bacteroidales bacterium]|nr:DUF4340 domain-containing protein [Bacteroidales bacterium]